MNKERLKGLREKKGVSQKEVALILGIDRTTYVKYEQGTSNPNVNRLIELAEYFGVPVGYLTGETVPDTNQGIENSADNLRSEAEQKIVDLYNSMPPEMQKAAIAQLEALAALNRK